MKLSSEDPQEKPTTDFRHILDKVDECKLIAPPNSDALVEKRIHYPIIRNDFIIEDYVDKEVDENRVSREVARKKNALSLLGYILHQYRKDKSKLPLIEGTSFSLPCRHFRSNRLETYEYRLKHLPAGYRFMITERDDRLKVITTVLGEAGPKNILYRSVDQFIPHLLWLEESSRTKKAFDHRECECRNCRAIYNSEVFVSRAHGAKDKEDDAKQNQKTSTGTIAAKVAVKRTILQVKEKNAKKYRFVEPIAEEGDNASEQSISKMKDKFRATIRIRVPMKEESLEEAVPPKVERPRPKVERAGIIALRPATRVFIEAPSVVDFLARDPLDLPLPTILPMDHSLLYPSENSD